MKKRFISFVLALIMVVSIAPPLAFAADTTDELETTSVIDKIINLVASVERAKESWGFGEVDFSNLYIGNPVFAYEYVDDSLEENSKLYPISEEGQLLFWAVVADDMVTISTDLIEQISGKIALDEPFSIIYDRYGCYAYTENSCEVLSAYEDDFEIETRSILTPKVIENNEEIVLTSLVSSALLEYEPVVMPYEPIYYYTLNVPVVNQLPNDKICWAACIASIVHQLKGTQVSAVDIAKQYYGYDYNDSANGDDVQKLLRENYNIDYFSYRAMPTDYVIYRNLLDNYPIYSRWKRVDGKTPGHACVLYGIDTYTAGGTVFLMDPFGGYFVTAEAANNSYYYHSVSYGTLFYMWAVVYHGTYF